MAEAPAQSPHDALFKAIFSNLEHARPMLQAALPAALASAIDWSTLELRPGSFVDAALKARHSDLLFTANVRGSPLLMYLLFEHQSTTDAWMPLRLLQYMLGVWQSHVEKTPGARRLPIVVPIVIHHSERGWTFEPSFEALFDVEAAGLHDALPYVPRFRFLLDDVSHATDDELRRRAITAVAKLALACFRGSRRRDELLDSLVPWLDVFGQVWRAPHGVHALQCVLQYAFQASGGVPERFGAFIQRVDDPALAEEIVTLAEMFENKGLQKGLQKGRQEGLHAGRAESLLLLLRAKFGKVSAKAAARVKAADEATLDRWLPRVLEASSVAEALSD